MDRDELSGRLRNTCGLTGHFVLRSGAVSDFYFDKYLFEADPHLLQAVAEHAAPLIPEGTGDPGRSRARWGTVINRAIPSHGYPAGPGAQRGQDLWHRQAG